MPVPAFDRAWDTLEAAARRSLELAFDSLVAGGLAVGSVLTDADGAIVAEERNRAYDPPGGPDVLRGTPLAHAEMNVLATIATDRDLTTCTLWSTQEPCSMCTAAAAFTGVGRVRYLAPDPWAVAADRSGEGRAAIEDAPSIEGPAPDPWLVVTANLLFMLGVGLAHGPDHPTIARNRELDPSTTAIVIELLAEPDATMERLHTAPSLATWLSAIWPRIVLP